MATASTPELLGLPAEIRNMIYKYAIVDKKSPIKVTEHLKQPPLLSVNRLIRSETLNIWYRENKFETTIRDCDATLLHAWIRNFDVVFPKGRKGLRTPGMWLHGRPHWPNLMSWCRLYLHSRIWYGDEVGNWSSVGTVIRAALIRWQV